MKLDEKHVMEALATVQDPDLGRDLVSLNMIKEASVQDEKVHVHVELTTPACPMKDRIRDDVVKAISDRAQSIGSTRPSVEVEFSAEVRGRDGDGSGSPLAGVRHVIAVGAGKGGVG